MDIDLTSIIIGIAALSTFFIPIGLHQFSQKQKIKRTQKSFENASEKNNLHIDDMEVLRNGIAIGIDSQNRSLLHLINRKEEVVEIDEVQSCKFYKHHRKETTEGGTETSIQEMGIQVILKKRQNRNMKLPLFEVNEGGIFGSEDFTIRKWIDKIHSIQKKNKREVI